MTDRTFTLTKVLGRAKRKFPTRGRVDPAGAMNLYREGQTLAQIGKFYGVVASTVQQAIQGYSDYPKIAAARLRSGPSIPALGHREKKVDPDLLWQHFEHGRSVSEIASVFGVRGRTIYRYLAQRPEEYQRILQANKETKRGTTNIYFPREEAWELFKAGATTVELSVRYGVSHVVIGDHLQGYPEYRTLVHERRIAPRPEKRIYSREEAIKLYQKGWTTIQIAKKFGVSREAVGRAVSGCEGHAEISFRNRSLVQRGHTGDAHPVSRSVITPEGRFGSINLASQHFGTNAATIWSRANSGKEGWRFEDGQSWFKNARPVITPKGRFANINLAAKKFHIHESAAWSHAHYQKHGWSFEDDLGEVPVHARARAVLTPGGKFRSVLAASEHHGIAPATVRRRIAAQHKGWSYSNE